MHGFSGINDTHNVVQPQHDPRPELFLYPKQQLPIQQNSTFLPPPASILFSVSVNSPTQRTHETGITECVSCCVCLMSLSITPSGSDHVGAWASVRISFLLKAERYSFAGVSPVLFIRSPVHRHLGCLHLVATVNNAAVNTAVRLLSPAFNAFVCVPAPGSTDHMVILL